MMEMDPIPVYSPPSHAFSSVGTATVLIDSKAPLPLSLFTKPTPLVAPCPPLPPIFHGSVLANFRAALRAINLDECDAHGENAFFVCDLAHVWRQHMRWQKELGARIDAFFAVKCNPDPHVLHLLASLGLGFDCASQPEIAAVLALPTRIPIDPSRIIYANPCKAPSFVRHAAKSGVQWMTFDNGDELEKVHRFHPNAKMVLRILTDDSGSLCRLGLKFGAPLGEVRALLRRAKAMGIDVRGISFHCGSGCSNPALFGDAVRRAKWAFDVGKEEGFVFDLLDVGGGFEDENFEAIAAVLRSSLDEHFAVDGAGKGVRVIAEPGRYYVSKAFELATNIIARRAAKEVLMNEEEEEGLVMVEMEQNVVGKDDDGVEEEEEKPTVMYYINDGVYGAFNCILFDHQSPHPQVLTLSSSPTSSSSSSSSSSASSLFSATEEEAELSYAFHATTPAHLKLEECSVWGPTCDSIDCVQKSASLPVAALKVGDWLRWEAMGAYTICAASQFNGFRRSEVRYTIDADSTTEATIRSLLA